MTKRLVVVGWDAHVAAWKALNVRDGLVVGKAQDLFGTVVDTGKQPMIVFRVASLNPKPERCEEFLDITRPNRVVSVTCQLIVSAAEYKPTYGETSLKKTDMIDFTVLESLTCHAIEHCQFCCALSRMLLTPNSNRNGVN